MKIIYNIAKNELRQLFYSPIAWILLAIFFVQAGMAFSETIGVLLRYRSLGFGLTAVTSQVFMDAWKGVYPAIQGYLFLYIPLLTMGIMSREKTAGTDKLLFSSPVSETQVVLGKFMSVAVYGLVMMSCIIIQILVCVVLVDKIDIGPVLSGFLGLYLLLLAYAAIGIFMSSLTKYQIIAAVGTVATLFTMNYMTVVGQGIPVLREITYWLGIAGRADTFIYGMICSEDLIYFLVVITLFLALTVLKLRFETVKRGRGRNALSYVAVIALFCLVGFVSSRPACKAYFDTTREKSNTLTEESQAVMEQMDGPLTITTYVNLIGPDAFYGLPKNYTRDLKRFGWYTRFKPEIKMKYVYYWHESALYPMTSRKFKGLDEEGKAKRMAEINRLNFKKFLTPEQIAPYDEKINLAEEEWAFIRVIEREDGSWTKLRLYDDQEKHPGEREITAAMKRLVMDVPVVGMLAGHNERDMNGIGDKGYFSFAQSRTFRHALMNQGFDVREVHIADGAIPEDISILMIADPQIAYSDSDLAAIKAYVDRGGDIIIAGKPYNRAKLEPVLELFGVEFMDGTLVQESEQHEMNLICGDITMDALETSLGYGSYIVQKKEVVGNGTMAILTDKAADKGFEVIDVVVTDSLATDTTRVWNEINTTDFVNDKPKFNPEKGEKILDKAPVVVALKRQAGEKEQRVVVLGNADMVANGELMMSRAGINAANYCLIMESFRYLSGGEFPIYAGREAPVDNELKYVGREARPWFKWIFNFILPAIIALLGIFVLLRRKSR